MFNIIYIMRNAVWQSEIGLAVDPSLASLDEAGKSATRRHVNLQLLQAKCVQRRRSSSFVFPQWQLDPASASGHGKRQNGQQVIAAGPRNDLAHSQRNDQPGQLLRLLGRALHALELSLPLSNSADALAVLIDHHFAIFLGKGLVHCWQDVQNHLGGPAQARAHGGLDEGAIDENRIGQHGIQQCVLAQRGIVQPQFQIGCAFLADCTANIQSGGGNQLDKPRSAGWVDQVLNDFRRSLTIAYPRTSSEDPCRQ